MVYRYITVIGLLAVGSLFNPSGAHGQNPGDLGCLEFEDSWTNHGRIDLNTGEYITDASNEKLVNQLASYSPDNQYIAYIPISNPNNPTFELFLKQNTLNGQNILLEANVKLDNTDDADYQWSHDSRWLAYSWQSGNGSYSLSLVAAGTGVNKTIRLNTETNDIVNLFGWSADDKYIAMARSNQDTNQQEITVWSVPALKLIKSISQSNDILGRDPVDYFDWDLFPDTIQWSPIGDWLSYLVVGNEKTGITLMSLSSNQTFHYQVPNINSMISTITQQLLWSPNGKYVAFLTAQLGQDYDSTGNMLWRLDLLGIDGTLLPNVTSKLSKQETIAGGTATNPVVAWAADGTTIFYAQNNSPQNDGQADLMAFQPEQNHYSVVQPNVLLNPAQTTDKRYLVYAWSNDNQNYTIDLLDTDTLGRIRSQDKLNLSTALEDLSIKTGTGSWDIIYEGAIPDKAFNVTTGLVRDLEPFYPISDGLRNTQDYRYLAAVIANKDSYELRWVSLDDGLSKHSPLASSQFDTPAILGISDDGQKIAILSNAAVTGHTILTIIRPEGSILRRLDILTPVPIPATEIGNAHFVQC